MSDFTIPPDLIDDLNEGNCVLFVGDSADEAGSASVRLASALADKCGVYCRSCKSHGKCQHPTSCEVPLTRVAQVYEKRLGRQALIDFVMRHIGNNLAPNPLHRALAALSGRIIITTAYDNRLETALHEAGRAYQLVVRDTDMPSDRAQWVQLIRLYGTLGDTDNLVITQNDAADLFGGWKPVTKIVIQAYLARKTLLFVGYNLDDPYFRLLYREITKSITRFQRPAYALQWPPDPLVAESWEGQITFIEADPLAFLTRLQQVVHVEKKAPALAPLPAEPYKFLDYFTRNDAAIFFGRDLEADLLLSNILAHPLTVFYGRSGVGKTSLLLARVGPRLEAEGYRVVYARMLNDPSAEVKAAVRGVPIGALNQIDQDRRLIDVIADALPPNGRVVIVLDQFEEFFLRQDESVRKSFAQELAACLPSASPAADVRMVVALRDDYLGALDELSHIAPQDIYANRDKLENLTRDKALLAILEPAKAFGLPVEEALRERLIADLQDQGLETTNLQIVLYRLYQDAVQQNLWHLDTRRVIGLTLKRYVALGGTREILAGYLDDVLNELPDEAQRQQARLILKSMVTPRQTKLAVSGQEISHGDLVGQAGLTEAQVTAQLTYLRDKRVVRKFGEEDRYELAHEVLVDKVWAWISDEELQLLNVRDMLRRELSNYERFKHLLTLEKLALINPHRASLALTPAELELLFRSALTRGDASTPEWFTCAEGAGLSVDIIAQEGLKSDNFQARAAAIKMLAQLGAQFIDCICEMLDDVYPQPRVAAIHALEKMQPTGEWRRHLKYECYVPAGVFIMGNDENPYSHESPAHEVNLEAFYIGKYHVTNAEYKRYLDDLKRASDIPGDKDCHPVVSVYWHDARDYAAWAGMRLPTEAQWEKAASWSEGNREASRQGDKGIVQRLVSNVLKAGEKTAGKKRVYPWGDKFDQKKCNTRESGIGDTTPVGNYSPQGDSAFGCADMAGNAWEWTSSLYRAYPYQAEDGRENPSSSGERVLRGGSFDYDPDIVQCTYRHGYWPFNRDPGGGFRVVVASISQ